VVRLTEGTSGAGQSGRAGSGVMRAGDDDRHPGGALQKSPSRPRCQPAESAEWQTVV